MTTLLSADELFKNGPATWLDWDAATWIHRGHVQESTVSEHVGKPIGPEFDALEVVPGTLRHEWMRFAEHDPKSECDDDYCDCPAADDESYLWTEKTDPGAEGAIPVTVVETISKDE